MKDVKLSELKTDRIELEGRIESLLREFIETHGTMSIQLSSNIVYEVKEDETVVLSDVDVEALMIF